MSIVEPKVFTFRIQGNSQYCGMRLQNIAFPKQCECLGLVRQDQVIFIQENPEIFEHDFILVVALNPMLIPTLKVCLSKAKQPVF